MLDIKLLREAPDQVVTSLRERRTGVFADLPPETVSCAERTVERLTALDRRYLDALRAEEDLRHRQKANSEAMKGLGSLSAEARAEARTRLADEGRALREREKELRAECEHALSERDEAWGRVPNLVHPDAPRGASDADSTELRRVGVPRDFTALGFTPRDHVELAEALDLVDFAAGAKVAGQKFYFLKNEAVYLDLALQRFALDVARRHGFTVHVTPDLARADILVGLGFRPRGESTQVYAVEASDLCLVGTAEITLGGMLADTIVPEEDLPLLVAGLSHCFRTEAGAAGQHSRGLYRVHQFTKVELFAFTRGDVEESDAMHRRLLAIEEEIFTALGLPYRVVDMATGDLGAPAYRKFDLEAWMPGRGDWGEVTSTSNCTDFQARRLKIRYRDSATAKNRFVHTLNGTAVAVSRALVAILENYQDADGTVVVPEVLRPLCGFDRVTGRGAPWRRG